MNRSIFFASRTGCLLPGLIALNLLFGWLFFKPLVWLAIGLIMILLLFLNAVIFVKKLTGTPRRRSNVIDVEAEKLDEK